MTVGQSQGTCVSGVRCTRVSRDGSWIEGDEVVLHESALEVFVNDALSMRVTCTPTNLRELTLGRLFSEGYVTSVEDIRSIDVDEERMCAHVRVSGLVALEADSAVVNVPTTGGGRELRCNFVYKVPALEQYASRQWDTQMLFRLMDAFMDDSPLHSLTAGTHSARLVVEDEPVALFEDIGRHNALDKAIGWMLERGISGPDALVFTSGRIPVDMAAKAIRAQLGMLASKAAPTDQAVRLARTYGLALACFGKDGDLRMY